MSAIFDIFSHRVWIRLKNHSPVYKFFFFINQLQWINRRQQLQWINQLQQLRWINLLLQLHGINRLHQLQRLNQLKWQMGLRVQGAEKG